MKLAFRKGALFAGMTALSLLGAARCGGGGETGTSTGTSSSSSSSSGSGGQGGGGGSGPISSYTPQGCGFTIAPRAEYKDFSLAAPTNGATPNIRRVRLGLGGNVEPGAAGHADPSTTIAVAWQTDEGTLASEIAWGSDPDPGKWAAKDRASGVTWATPGTNSTLGDERMHEVYLCGLTPATTYYYRVGGGPAGGEAWSEVQSFTTTPAPGATKVTIGLTGDSRGEAADAWRASQRRMTTLAPSLQLFSGDMNFLATDQASWEHWLDSAVQDADQKALSFPRVLTLSTHGNHENHTTFFYGNLVMPQDQAKYPQYAELFYSFDVGPVHVVVLDDYWIGTPTGDPAYKDIAKGWLEADLAAANNNRAKVPWVMVMHHHGELSSSAHGSDGDMIATRKFLMPIWDKYGVDLAIAGHDHNYERSKPQVITAGGDPADPPSGTRGTVYVVCAGVGAPGYGSGTSSWTATSHAFADTGGIGVYGLITADASSLKLDAFELRSDNSDPSIDSFTLTKP